MSPVLRQAGLLLLAPWQQRRNVGGIWSLYLTLALVVLVIGGPAVAAFLWWPQGPRAFLPAVLASVLVLLLWFYQFSLLLRLDHPHAARLVPGHSAALRRMALGLWLALIALVTCAFTLALPLSLAGDAAVALAVGAALLFCAMALRWWWLWFVLWLNPWNFGHMGVFAPLGPAVDGAVVLWRAQPLVGLALGLLVLGWLLCSLFGAGGSAHREAYRSRERMRRITQASMSGQKPVLAAYGRWGKVVGAPLQRLVDAWFARVTAHAQPQRHSVMARAEIVLHGAQHWVRHAGGTLVALSLITLGFTAVLGSTGKVWAQVVEHGFLGMAIGAVSMAVSPVFSLRGSLWLSRREQGLLLLLPGMPRGGALNRALAFVQMRHFGLAWLFSAVLLMGLAVSAGRSAIELAALLPALPLGLLLWRDPSRMRPGQLTSVLLPVFGALLGGVAAFALVRSQPELLLPLSLTTVTLTAALGAWRWHQLGRLPQALPAGRWS